MAEDNSRSFDLKSWQGLTEVLKYARESNLTPEEYGAFRNLVLEYAQQKGTDPALKKKIDDLILTFHKVREEKEEAEDSKKHTHKKKEERMGRRVIPSFMPTFAKVDALDVVPEVPKAVTPPPEVPVPPPAPVPEPLPVPPPVPPVVVEQSNVLRSIEEYRQRILDVKRRVNSLVGNPIALVDNGNTIGRDYMAALLNALKATSPGSTQNVEEAMDRLETTFNRILEYSVRARGGTPPEPSVSPSDVASEQARVVSVHPSVTTLPPEPETKNEIPAPVVVREPEPVDAYVPPPAPPPTPPPPPYIPPPTPVREEAPAEHIPVQNDPVYNIPIRRIPVDEVSTPPPPPPAPPAPVYVPEPEPEPEPERTPLPEPVFTPEPPQREEPAFEPVSVPEPEPSSVEFFAVPPQDHTVPSTEGEEKVTQPATPVIVDDAFASRTLGDISENGLSQSEHSDAPKEEDVPQPPADTYPIADTQSETEGGDTRWSESGGDANLEEQIEELRRQLHETETSGHAPRAKIPSLIDLENALPGGDLREGEGPHAYMAPEEFDARELTKRPESSLTGITLGTPQAELMSPDVTMALTELLHEWNIFASSGIFGFGPGGIEHPLYVKLSGLPVGEVLAGRFEGVDMKIVRTIKDYVNAWRHEQGIAYNPSETFEHYLRRVAQRILKRQQGIRD